MICTPTAYADGRLRATVATHAATNAVVTAPLPPKISKTELRSGLTVFFGIPQNRRFLRNKKTKIQIKQTAQPP